MYRLPTILTFVTLSVGLALAQSPIPATAGLDKRYDDPKASLSDFACAKMLQEKYNYYTLGSLATFPFVGSSETVDGPDSPNCGKCYEITYGSYTIPFVAIDSSDIGFNMASRAFYYLTDVVSDERVKVSYLEVAPSTCFLPN